MRRQFQRMWEEQRQEKEARLNVVPEVDEERAEDDSEMAVWRHHPGTQRFANGLRKSVELAEGGLIAACLQSDDPKVRGAAVLLNTLYRQLTDVEGKNGE